MSKNLEARIISIKKDSYNINYIIDVEVYSLSLLTDEYQYKGQIFLEDITQYNPKTSIKLIVNKSY